MDNIVYQLADDRLWSVPHAAYVDKAPEGAQVIQLVSAEGDGSEGYLLRTLKYYGYPLGELVEKDPDSIKAALKKLDEQYLTPRMLANLARSDEYALKLWQAHEEAAAPLRESLAKLTGFQEQSLTYSPRQS